MRDGARLQEVIALLDLYRIDLGPLDEYVQKHLKQRRYIGSHDRRQITHDIFNIYRTYSCLQKLCHRAAFEAVTGRSLVLAYLIAIEQIPLGKISTLFSGQKYHPPALSEAEIQMVERGFNALPSIKNHLCFPDWLCEKLSTVFKEETVDQLSALNQQAAVDLCVNINKRTREKVIELLERQGIQAENTPHSPLGIRLQKRTDLRQVDLFKQGIIDIQDEGAQLISLLSDVKPEMIVCDYCAGAGGKTRTWSILLNNQGTIIATDSVPERIQKLQQRLKRGHHSNIRVVTLAEVHEQSQQACDRVLLDVPCSGTGTFRRHPELKMILSPEKINQFVLMQRQILNDAAHLVTPKGYLIYATCSLLPEENEKQVEWFLAHNPNFKMIPVGPLLLKKLGHNLKDCQDYLRLTPYTHGTDGFFAAVFAREKS